jgi:hypothetical protein
MPTTKPLNTTRIYFTNVNGLRLCSKGGDFSDVCTTMNDSHIDIFSIAETKLYTCQGSVVSRCEQTARQIFDFSSVVLASSAINYSRNFKPGWAALITAGSTTGRIITTFQDPMGRWCTTSYLGANTSKLSVISAYQVCDTAPDRKLTQRNTIATSHVKRS